MNAWLVPLCLVLCGLAVNLNTLPNAFIFDDTPWIVENTRIRSLSNLSEILTATNRPVLELSLALNYAVGGENPAGYHALNMAIHILAGLVLYGLVRRTLQLPQYADRFKDSAVWLGGAVALLWLVHPLNTQSVTYIIQRGESLTGLCYLFTLYSVLRYATGGGVRWSVTAIVACWLAVGVKEVIATAPLVVLLYDRTFLADSWREIAAKRWGVYLGLFAMWVPMAVLLTKALSGPDASAGFALEDKLLSRWTYLLTQAQVIPEVYLYKSLWPHPLVLDYAWLPAIPEDTPTGEVMRLFLSNVLWQGLVVVGLLLVSLWGAFRRTWWGFLGLSFFLILAPTSSFVPIADIAVEHRMYLPLIAVVCVVVFGVYALLRKAMGDKAWLYGVLLLGVVATVLGLHTVTRNFDYRTRISIWDSTVIARPLNARAWHNLAAALETDGRHEESLACYERVLDILPNYTAAHFGMGGAWLSRNEVDLAIKHFQMAVVQKPDNASYQAHLGKALMLALRLDEAEVSLRRAIELDPKYGRSYEYLGLVLLGKKDIQGAIEQFRAGMEADPTLSSNYHNLAAALANVGRFDEAATVCGQAIQHAKDIKLTDEEIAGFRDRRERYLAQAVQAPASP
jgi:tetratricopeptide (TPR) repeat protein